MPVLRALRQQGSLTIRACYDTNLANARRVARRLDAALAEPGHLAVEGDADAVLIATPPESHAEIAFPYVQAGKHVLVEKPFVTNVRDGEALLDAAKTSGARVLVNHHRRFYPAVVNARRFVSDGAGLGTIHRVQAGEGVRWSWPTSSDYVVRSPFGGVVFDIGTHVIDTMLFVLGLDDADGDMSFVVEALHRSPDTEPAHECRSSIRIASDRTGTFPLKLMLSRREPLANLIKIDGAHGTLLVPTSFASQPCLYLNGHDFLLETQVDKFQPPTAPSVFSLVHRELLRVLSDPTVRSPLGAEHLSPCTAMLVALTDSEMPQ